MLHASLRLGPRSSRQPSGQSTRLSVHRLSKQRSAGANSLLIPAETAAAGRRAPSVAWRGCFFCHLSTRCCRHVFWPVVPPSPYWSTLLYGGFSENSVFVSGSVVKILIMFSLLLGWWGTGTGCPEKLWLPPPWQCSRPGWMELWATWSGGRCPFSWQGGWNPMIFKVPSNPCHSMILFYDSKSNTSLPGIFHIRHLVLSSSHL